VFGALRFLFTKVCVEAWHDPANTSPVNVFVPQKIVETLIFISLGPVSHFQRFNDRSTNPKVQMHVAPVWCKLCYWWMLSSM